MADSARRLLSNIERVVVGKPDQVALVVAAVISRGHVLLEDVPGTAKTILARAKLTRLTNRTVSTPAELKRALAEVRRQGYAIIDQELEIGLRSIAVPVKDAAGTCVAAINVGTQSARVSVAEMQARFLAPLQAAASELAVLVR